jgi:UDP-glucuronate 4-epimerase
MSQYMVTGAAGFIASRLCEILLEAGHQVVGLDNLNDAYDVRMKEYRLRRLEKIPGFRFLHLDISKDILPENLHTFKENLQSVSSPSFDAVVNLAARAGVRQSVADPWVYFQTNLTGTLNLLEFCRQNDIPKFVLASTSSVYGDNSPLPTPETAPSDRPIQPYAASKKAAEVLCHAYHSLYGIDITVFRYFTVFGPAGRPDMSMFRFVQWISENHPLRLFGDGQQSRGFTYVDDIVRGTILGLAPLGFQIINLGGHESIKINDLISIMEEVIGKRAEVVHLPADPADMLASWADTTKARQLLGWQPKVDLHEGITRMVKWYNAERSWAKDIFTA